MKLLITLLATAVLVSGCVKTVSTTETEEVEPAEATLAEAMDKSTQKVSKAEAQEAALPEISPAEESGIMATYKSMLTGLPEHIIKCIPDKTIICTKGNCQSAELTHFTLLTGTDINDAIYRCDAGGCGLGTTHYKLTGDIGVIEADEPRGYFLKRQQFDDNGEELTETPFVEVTSSRLNLHISYGICIDR